MLINDDIVFASSQIGLVFDTVKTISALYMLHYERIKLTVKSYILTAITIKEFLVNIYTYLLNIFTRDFLHFFY